jgi:hypothetical protein
MQFEKSQIIEFLENRGDRDKASQAQTELPDKVDTDQHSEHLSKLGIDPSELPGGGGGGLKDTLGL